MVVTAASFDQDGDDDEMTLERWLSVFALCLSLAFGSNWIKMSTVGSQ